MVDANLLMAADKYDIKHLQDICEMYIIKDLTVDNVVQIGIATHLSGSEEYQHSLLQFIAHNWKVIRNGSNYHIISTDPDLLTKVISYVTSQNGKAKQILMSLVKYTSTQVHGPSF